MNLSAGGASSGGAADEGAWLEPLRRRGAAFAPSTVEAAARGFRFFRFWCARQGLCALPAEPATVAAFLDHYAQVFAPTTMMGHLYGVRMVHAAVGLPDPLKAELVRLARLRQLQARPRRRRIVVTEAMRDRMLAACPDTLLGLRDRALISLCFDTLCHRSEVCLLRIEEMQLLPGGTAQLAVRRLRDPPDVVHDTAFLSKRGVARVQEWLSDAGLTAGPILRSVRYKRAFPGCLPAQVINERLKLRAKAAGIHLAPGQYLSAHSLRIGAAQALAARGRTLVQVMRAGRWRSLDIPAEYLREATQNVWANSDGDTLPENAGAMRWRWMPRGC